MGGKGERIAVGKTSGPLAVGGRGNIILKAPRVQSPPAMMDPLVMEIRQNR